MVCNDIDYELAPHLLRLFIEESRYNISKYSKRDYSVPFSESCICSFYIGRQKGVSTAVREWIKENSESKNMIAYVTPYTNLISKRNLICVDVNNGLVNHDLMFRGINFKVGFIFDSCTKKQVDEFLKKNSFFPELVCRDKVDFVVSVGQL